MELHVTADLQAPHGLSSHARASCFHPRQSRLFVAFGSVLVGYNVVSQSIDNLVTCSKPITHLEHSNDHSLFAALSDGSVILWDTTANRLQKKQTFVAPKRDGRRAFYRFSVHHSFPMPIYLVFVRYNMPKDVLVYCISDTKQIIKLDGRKRVYTFAVHPTRSVVCVCYIDGRVVLWDYRAARVLVSVESNDYGLNPAHSKSKKHQKERELEGDEDLDNVSNVEFRVRSDFPSLLEFLETDDEDDLTVVLGCRNGQLGIITYSPSDSGVKLQSSQKIQTRIVGRDVYLTCMARLPQSTDLVTCLGNGQLCVWTYDQASGTLHPNPTYALQQSLVPVKLPGELSNYLEVTSLCFHPITGLLCPRFRRSVPRTLSQPLRIQITESMGAYSSSNSGLLRVFSLDHLREPMISIAERVQPLSLPLRGSFFFAPKPLFDYPPTICYLSGATIRQYHLASGIDTSYHECQAASGFGDANTLFLVHSQDRTRFLVFFSFFSAETCTRRYTFVRNGAEHNKPGRDAIFLGDDDQHYLILADNGSRMRVFGGGVSTGNLDLLHPMDRMFNHFSRKALLFFDSTRRRLLLSLSAPGTLMSDTPILGESPSSAAVASSSSSSSSSPPDTSELDFQSLMPDEERYLELGRDESVCQITWRIFDSDTSTGKGKTASKSWAVGAILTSHRLLLVDASLRVLQSLQSCREVDATLPSLAITSCFWIDTCLLFATSGQLRYMTLDGRHYPICTLPCVDAIITAVLNDRVIFASSHLHALSLENQVNRQTRLFSQSIGLLEPLLMGLLALIQYSPTSTTFTAHQIELVVSRFDCTRVRGTLLAQLAKVGFANIAYTLVRRTAQLDHNWVLRFGVAVRACQYSAALDILTGALALKAERSHLAVEDLLVEIQRLHRDASSSGSINSSKFPGLAQFVRRLRGLAQLCCHYGQFNMAQRCFHLLGDTLWLTHLALLNRSVPQLQLLKKRSEVKIAPLSRTRSATSAVVSNHDSSASASADDSAHARLFSASNPADTRPLSAQLQQATSHAILERALELCLAAQLDDSRCGDTLDERALTSDKLPDWEFQQDLISWHPAQITSGTMRTRERTDLDDARSHSGAEVLPAATATPSVTAATSSATDASGGSVSGSLRSTVSQSGGGDSSAHYKDIALLGFLDTLVKWLPTALDGGGARTSSVGLKPQRGARQEDRYTFTAPFSETTSPVVDCPLLPVPRLDGGSSKVTCVRLAACAERLTPLQLVEQRLRALSAAAKDRAAAANTATDADSAVEDDIDLIDDDDDDDDDEDEGSVGDRDDVDDADDDEQEADDEACVSTDPFAAMRRLFVQPPPPLPVPALPPPDAKVAPPSSNGAAAAATGADNAPGNQALSGMVRPVKQTTATAPVLARVRRRVPLQARASSSKFFHGSMEFSEALATSCGVSSAAASWASRIADSVANRRRSQPKLANSNEAALASASTPPRASPPVSNEHSPREPGRAEDSDEEDARIQAWLAEMLAEDDEQSYSEYFARCLEKLEHGHFPTALDDAQHALRLLLKEAKEDSSAQDWVRRAVKLSVLYKLAVRILIEIKLIEQSRDLTRLAYLSSALATLPLFPRHRLVCLRMAAAANLEAHNYGIAAPFLKTLLSLEVPDAAEIRSRLQLCEDRKLSNEAPEVGVLLPQDLTTSPGCFLPCFCFQTFEHIDKVNLGSWLRCSYCAAIFSSAGAKQDDACSYCSFGEVVSVVEDPLSSTSAGTLPCVASLPAV
eukprot:CAMPEP_0174231428 /NCGR_PEP_ID=MMETSP0417-20130205/1951_1 /TAXON_ID=242541 /ORGANISM="Mayorella sp, Strain BSH-02190019" /LENGTH=1743 /DNA_ID=CAMNT_0015309311 /DNA_START=239 /DNA_END=5470 /DNA_ORIENTATION=-